MIVKKLRQVLTEFAAYLKEREKKRIFTQLRELVLLWRLDERFPGYYLRHRLYSRDIGTDVSGYLPESYLARFREGINPEEAWETTRNKALYTSIMQDNHLPVVPILYLIEADRTINHAAGRELNFQEFVAELCQNYSEIFIKPTHGFEGQAAQQMSCRDHQLWLRGKPLAERDFFETLFFLPRYNRFLVQSVVTQHPLLNSMNESSVNTVRIDTLVCDDGVIRSSGAFLRVGSGGSWVDNVAAGGFHLKVDVETGAVAPRGYGHVKFGRQWMETHPVSGFRFEEVTLPFWGQVAGLIEKGARALAPLRYLGWDIAFTAEGPILMEASAIHDLFVLQSAVGGLRYTPVGQAALQAINK